MNTLQPYIIITTYPCIYLYIQQDTLMNYIIYVSNIFNDILVGMHKFKMIVLFVLFCNIYEQIDFIS